jgi:hypothetical protein
MLGATQHEHYPRPVRSNLLPRRTGLNMRIKTLRRTRQFGWITFRQVAKQFSVERRMGKVLLAKTVGSYMQLAPSSSDRGLFVPPIRIQNNGCLSSSAGEESGVTSPEWRDIYAYRRPQLGYQETIHFNDLTPIEIGSTLDRIRFDVRRKWENQR